MSRPATVNVTLVIYYDCQLSQMRGLDPRDRRRASGRTAEL